MRDNVHKCVRCSFCLLDFKAIHNGLTEHYGRRNLVCPGAGKPPSFNNVDQIHKRRSDTLQVTMHNHNHEAPVAILYFPTHPDFYVTNQRITTLYFEKVSEALFFEQQTLDTRRAYNKIAYKLDNLIASVVFAKKMYKNGLIFLVSLRSLCPFQGVPVQMRSAFTFPITSYGMFHLSTGSTSSTTT
ncbi:hypothetical protein GJ496_001228 [Pomphorhynchus laevis]|nr:hypothetical protein GJ496_001228 [Pomphorhynchus laevis]